MFRATDPATKKAMSDFNRSETIRGADFSTPYQLADTSEPLFTNPLLITEVNIAHLAGGSLRLQCAEKLSGAPPRTFELVLSETLSHAFMHLLERAVVASTWRGAAAAAPSADGPVAAPPVSGYLN